MCQPTQVLPLEVAFLVMAQQGLLWWTPPRQMASWWHRSSQAIGIAGWSFQFLNWLPVPGCEVDIQPSEPLTLDLEGWCFRCFFLDDAFVTEDIHDPSSIQVKFNACDLVGRELELFGWSTNNGILEDNFLFRPWFWFVEWYAASHLSTICRRHPALRTLSHGSRETVGQLGGRVVGGGSSVECWQNGFFD